MRRTATLAAAAAVAAAAMLAIASPASAAPPPAASCVGQVFVPQATGDPGAIAQRIAEIKGFIDVPWGLVASDFAQWEVCNP